MPIPSQKKKEVYFLFFNIFKAVFNVEVKNLMTKLEVVFVLESIYYFAKCIFDCRQCYCYRFRDDVFFFFFLLLFEREKEIISKFIFRSFDLITTLFLQQCYQLYLFLKSKNWLG